MTMTTSMTHPRPDTDARGMAAPLPRSCRHLLIESQRALDRAMRSESAAERFAAAHLAALRSGAAILATQARSRRASRGSVWALLSRAAPEFGDWAAFFAAGTRLRHDVTAGIAVRVSEQEADDMVRAAGEFMTIVEQCLPRARGR